jgi:putative sterol carrier protein
MTDATAEFFDELGRRDHDPRFERITGTFRFDIERGKRTDHWFVAIDKGDITVSRDDAPADASVHIKKALFERVIAGEANVVAALLRGEIGVEGDVRVLVQLRRLFPGPPSAGDRLPAAGYSRRQR